MDTQAAFENKVHGAVQFAGMNENFLSVNFAR
jgi:hypothetical protein